LGFHLMADATRDIASALNRIGLRARAKLVSINTMFDRASDSRDGVQISLGGWGADYPTPNGFLFNIFDCRAFVPASPINSNFSEFCDRRVQAAMARARAVEESDVGASAPLWAKVDRLITNAAPAATIATQRNLALISKRVQNYRFHPQWGPLLSQVTLR
jgi:peptide/nickel transport system substrate-binding protein